MPADEDPADPPKPNWGSAQWHTRRPDQEPDAGLAMRIVAFLCFEIMAAVVCGLLFGFGPFYMAFHHDKNTIRRNTDQQTQELNWAALNFKRNSYAGMAVGVLGGAITWYRINRKRPPEKR